MRLQKETYLIKCACGCGGLIPNRDSKNRPKRYIHGHNSPEVIEKIKQINTGRISPMKGKKFSLEARKHMSLAHLGKKLSKEHSDNIGKSNKGRGLGIKLSEETKSKIREKRKLQVFSSDSIEKMRAKSFERWSIPEYKAMLSEKFRQHWIIPEERERRIEILRKHILRGEKASGWRGGVSFIPYTKDFNKQLKKVIRDRDKHTCQLCGMPEIENGKLLTVHHIDYDKANSVIDNLISLCVSCNSLVNGNRNYWFLHFMNYLLEEKA